VKSRAGDIGVITKVYKEISDMIACNKCDVGDISLKLNKFDQAWYEFIWIHEKYFALLEHETEKESACISYEEQRKRNLNFDAMITELRQKAKIELHDETESRRAKSI
jgi:hypothetical protein